MPEPAYNPATAADAEQHAQEKIAGSRGRALRRPAAGAGLAAALLASAWVFTRRILTRQKRASRAGGP